MFTSPYKALQPSLTKLKMWDEKIEEEEEFLLPTKHRNVDLLSIVVDTQT